MGEWPDFWKQIDRMKEEHDSTRQKINRRKGWKFKGCEVFGIRTSWRAEYRKDLLFKDPVLVKKATSAELLAEVARMEELCLKCFHKLSRCGGKGCTVNNHGEKCPCEEHKKESA